MSLYSGLQKRIISIDIVKLKAHTRIMTLADKITSARLILAPSFFLVYFLPRFFPAFFGATPIPFGSGVVYTGAVWTVPVLWLIAIVSELSDLFDGKIARKRGEVSDFGKLFDPFADTLTKITYFLCFVIDGIFPPFLFLLVLYREFSILFVRNLMLKKGVALGARLSGKVKTVIYVVAGGFALLATSLIRFGVGEEYFRWFVLTAQVIFVLSVIVSIYSFVEYTLVYIKTPKTGSANQG